MQLSYQHVNKRSAISPTDNARRQQNGSAQHADAGPRPAASAESAAGRISPEGGGARSFKESGEPACGVQPIKAHHLQSAKLHTETRGHKQRVRCMHGPAQASRPSQCVCVCVCVSCLLSLLYGVGVSTLTIPSAQRPRNVGTNTYLALNCLFWTHYEHYAYCGVCVCVCMYILSIWVWVYL